MGYAIKSWFRVETTRLLWLTGVLFALVFAFQFLELPYGNVVSSLFPSREIPVGENTDSAKVSNVTHVNGSNFTGADAPNVTTNGTLFSGGKENDQTNVSLNVSSGFDFGSGSSNKSSSENLDLRNSSSVENGQSSNNITEAKGIGFITESVSPENETMHGNSSENVGNFNAGFGSPSPAPSPIELLAGGDLGKNTDIQNPVVFANSTTSSAEKNQTSSLNGDGKPVKNEGVLNTTNNTPQVKKETKISSSAVITIDEMDNLLRESHVSYHSVTPRWPSAADQELLDARLQIENAPIIKNDAELYAPNYRNLSMFKRSYELMEEKLKVYVYKEGARPILHDPFLGGIYASEGWFMRQMEANKQFVINNPEKAHLFYLPFSSRRLEETLYVQNSHSHKNLVEFLKNYVDLIASKYPFWNRTEGADHFLVACHDWAPTETKKYMANCIRALCNADMKEGYVFGKDISLPETYVRTPKTPLRNLGGKPPSKRSILAFFSGQMHGYLRPILLQHWENKDPDMKIFGQMPKIKKKSKNKNKNKNEMDYVEYMKSSKYCICPRGYEVNSPRVVEAIFYECVPVIISDNFIPPFFEVLNWKSFAVFVEEKDVPNLKNILMAIPMKRYLQLKLRVKKVQKHFLWNPSPERYDIFHMILHSVWYNRVFQMK